MKSTATFTFTGDNNVLSASNFMECVHEHFRKAEVFLFCPNGLKYIFESALKAIIYVFKQTLVTEGVKLIKAEIVDMESRDICCTIETSGGTYIFKTVSSFYYTAEEIPNDNIILETAKNQPYLDHGQYKMELARREFSQNFTSVELQEVCWDIQLDQYASSSIPNKSDVERFDKKMTRLLDRYFGKDKWLKYDIESIELGYVLKIYLDTGESVSIDRPI